MDRVREYKWTSAEELRELELNLLKLVHQFSPNFDFYPEELSQIRFCVKLFKKFFILKKSLIHIFFIDIRRTPSSFIIILLN